MIMETVLTAACVTDKLLTRKDEIVLDVLKKLIGEDALSLAQEEFHKRVTFVREQFGKHETIFVDGIPVVRFFPVTFERPAPGDRFQNKVKVTIPVQFFVEAQE